MKESHAGHNHAHTQGMTKQTLRFAFLMTIFILVAELAGGYIANSLALFSDAGHVVTDLFALGLAWFAAIQAERPANARKTFGYHRVGILAALLNAATLVVIALTIMWEAVQRLQHPEPVQPFVMFIAAGIGIAINLYIGLSLQKGSDNLNIRAATLHVFGDVVASVGVIIAGMIILFTGWSFVDALLSVGIALLISIGAVQILRETTDILLEAVPKGISMSHLVDEMKRIEGVQDVHDLHVWSIASGMYALSCHTVIDDLPPSNSSPILQSLTSMLNEKYAIGHTTIQFECANNQGVCCEINGLYCHMEAIKEKCNGDDHTDKESLAEHDRGARA